MPPKADISLLFHPKKNARKNTPVSSPKPNPGGSPGPKPSPALKPPPPKAKEDDEEELQLPVGGYSDYKLMSSALNGWKYDVFKFDSRKSVDIMRWQAPIKLNRKDLRRGDPAASGVGLAVRPMLGPDGQQVIGVDGKPVMVDVDGRPVTDNASGSGSGKGKGFNGNGNNKKKFQKKTRQVFIVPDEIRNLRKEERYPWVIEDASGQETWTAQLEDTTKSGSYAFFMPAANEIFKFVPSHRYYKFQKKLHHDLPTDTITMESAYVKSQKRDPSVWLHQRNGKGPSAATAAMFKAEAEGRTVSGGSGSLVYDTQQSLGPGGRKLKAVDSGADLFGEDEEDGEGAKKRAREYGGEGDLDEITFEEDFADDEEKMDVEDTNDQEAKELEERLKKEYKNANKTREGYIDESDEEEEKPGMSKQAKAMQKIIRAREGNDVYDSEEEDNPYASSQEEEEEEEPAPPTGPAVQPQSQPHSPPESQSSETGEAPKPSLLNGNGVGAPGSRATSPVLGGHSVVAKRATSPKAPKLKTNGASRSGSPLASRATSPVGAGPTDRANSPVAGIQQGMMPLKKRKAEDAVSPTSPVGAGPPKQKKRKAPTSETGLGAVATPTGPLEDRLLIEWLKNTPNASTRECIQYFTPYIKDDPEMKKKFTTLVKEVAQLKNGVLVLRSAYQGGSAAPSPAPTPSG